METNWTNWKRNGGNHIPFVWKSFFFLRYFFTKRGYCPFCGKRVPLVPGGRPFPRKHAKCIFCGSLERHRFLYYIYQIEILSDPRRLRILHFAPERAVYELFSRVRRMEYICCDIRPEDYCRIPGCLKIDACRMDFPDRSFDVVIANHLMEHIDEELFLNELHRVLKDGGIALLSTPVDMGTEKTLEDPRYDTPLLRTQYYGHPLHLRKYGRDIVERFSRYFETRFVAGDALPPMGDPLNSNCLILRKTGERGRGS